MRLESKLRRRGKRTGARPHRQKIPDQKVLEILALNLPINIAAKRAGISQTAFYRRAQRLDWNFKTVRAQENDTLERVYELRARLCSHTEIPSVEEIMRQYNNELRVGGLKHSPDQIAFVGYLEAELRTRPEVIEELRASKGRLGSPVLALARRICKRAREPRGISPSKRVGRPEGMTKDRIEEARKLEMLIEKQGAKRGAIKHAAMQVYSELRPDLAYDRARQTRKDYNTWKAENREKN